jgi:hypothetical protein
MEGQEPAKIEKDPASLEQLDAAVAEFKKAKKDEDEKREVLRQATIAWQEAKGKTDKKRQERNRVMRLLKGTDVTVLAARADMKHPQASRILAEGQ